MIRCKFESCIAGDAIIVVDRNQGMSVTNDIEAVVKWCIAAYPQLSASPAMVYRDSEGRWDGVSIVLGEFAGFVSLGAPSPELALIGLLHENLSAFVGTLVQTKRVPPCFSVKGFEGARHAFRALRDKGLH